ncbi:hypothetical protein ACX3U9_08680 [Corynebacterium pyruviciproducens]|uniref:Uncharacterized protein n=1 Tax=Corynebacterium pyruviciproducens ATCC BAA-1742 TaxID=1125779 RepID=S2Z3A4_9CORY|nr:hypothetical protein [Corynebacterium pyruviciproducens]EPD70896.1 hypothetical protein HMPREF1219_00191 [Corynebacterium pyruviciproducens ATCC BAA-1742]MDK6565787.1 hypothetical protein [Corynebacterium pyruviciproducens]MDK7213766.1 hypothetical protein [Corynebacterium pyruviciproducens]
MLTSGVVQGAYASVVTGFNQAVAVVAQSGGPSPENADSSQASPIGLLVVAVMMLAILFLGWRLARRIARLNRRRAFAEEHGIDVFDEETLNKAMREAGMDIPKRRPLI